MNYNEIDPAKKVLRAAAATYVASAAVAVANLLRLLLLLREKKIMAMTVDKPRKQH